MNPKVDYHIRAAARAVSDLVTTLISIAVGAGVYAWLGVEGLAFFTGGVVASAALEVIYHYHKAKKYLERSTS